VGTGDFNADGNVDIVLQNDTTRSIGVWAMNGVTVISGLNVDTTPDAGWKVVGTGDFNADGRSDIVLQNATTRVIGVWMMDGVSVADGLEVDQTPAANWRVAAVR
jgi:hypothetical protein